MNKGNLARVLLMGTSVAAIAFGNTAFAQDAAPQEDIQEVIVVGSRAAQQSAIDRKKKAKTATDSIVADDVGSFPDRNLNEAISRIAGMSISRGETGEGEGLTLRGNGPDLTRVEMDGMSVVAPGADLIDGGADGSGRGADLRELPADLIKSVDVVKGQTPDMTEGGLGGSVQIQTRTGLDFKKPYVSMRVAGTRNSLSEKWVPDLNIVASRKFFDNRLGVIFNLTKTRSLGDSHKIDVSGSSGNQGYARFIDLDGSAEKTFTYNPALVTGAGATDPVQSFALAGGGGNFNTLTPLEIVTRSANAQSKADCMAAFPLYTAAQLNTVSAGSNNGNRNLVQQQRINEQVTCLNQWNDYTPALSRDMNITKDEDRLAWDVRLDYKVNDNLTVFAKYQVADRTMQEYRRNRTRGGIAISNLNSLVNNTNIAIGTPNVITAPAGYSLFNQGFTTGSTTFDSTQGGSTVNNAFANMGIGVNIVPGTVEYDENHHLTSAQITNGTLSYDNIRNTGIYKSNYLQVGGNYRNGPLRVDFQASHSEGEHTRTNMRFRRSAFYGTGRLYKLESGLWDVEFPDGFDPDDMQNSVILNPATVARTGETAAQNARYSNNITLELSPGAVETSEDMAKLDAVYQMPEFPVLKRLKSGFSYRKIDTNRWGGGGYEPKTGVVVPTNTLRGVIRACENQPTTTALNACAYGFVPSTNLYNTLYGTETVTRDQLISIYANSVEVRDKGFMTGYEGVEGMKQWNTLDLDKAYAMMAGTLNYNSDCVKVCRGTDGILYDQPLSQSTEEVLAAYYMFDFEQALPLGMTFDGNFGVRMVNSKVNGNGSVTLASVRKNFSDDGDPSNDWNAGTGNGNVTTTRLRKPVSIQREYTDWLPSYNANLWLIDDKLVARYNWTKAINRPPIGALWPAGECTVDERTEDLIDEGDDDLDMRCTTFGNPDLKPYMATRNNTTLEWYPNKDTFLSLAYFRQKVRVGGAERYVAIDQPVFNGTDEVDPVTGRPLSDFLFTYTTYRNAPGYTTSGWELSSKTAFTFLPWRFRYTGADFNVSTSKLKGTSGYIDLVTGDNVGVTNRPDYYINLTLWYDDGTTNARLAYQARDTVLKCVSPCGSNIDTAYAYPNQNPSTFVRLPYNPGEPFYTREYAYLDAKVTHKFTPNVEFYFEGRNLLKEATITEGTRGFSDGDYQWAATYGGRKFTVGFVYRN